MKLTSLSTVLSTALIAISMPQNAEAFWGKKPTQWPDNWSQFTYPPSDAYKPYATVKFTTSLEQACAKYLVSYKSSVRADEAHKPVVKESQRLIDSGQITEDEYKSRNRPTWTVVWKAEAREVSAGVEVLRQFGDPDWKDYSLYNINGVGEKWREGMETKKFKAINTGYAILPYRKLSDICGDVY